MRRRKRSVKVSGPSAPYMGAMQPQVVQSSGGDLEQLYREQGDRLWWSVLAFAGDRDVASDAVAEAFAQALRRWPELRSPAAWVWTAAFKIAAGELKRRSAYIAGAVPERAYLMDEEAWDVAEAVAKLSAKQRVAVLLHYYADRPISEVAEILGTSPVTVAVHLHRGRKRLRQLLGDDADA